MMIEMFLIGTILRLSGLEVAFGLDINIVVDVNSLKAYQRVK